MDTQYIAIDFDGTLAAHEFPNIGAEVPNAFDTCKQLQAAGVKLILYTMRSGKYLDEAVAFCKARGIEFYGINVNPTQHTWTQSPKAYAEIYIDDAALGCPLIHNQTARSYVDWKRVRAELVARHILQPLEKNS